MEKNSDDNNNNKGEAVGNKGVSSDKAQNLVDIANNTFRELCRTLENEQTKLTELEERRKKLQEEMQRLKMEIEEEKQSYRLNLAESVADNLDALKGSNASGDANVEGVPVETETVHEFLNRQRAEIERLTQDSAQFPPLEVGIELCDSNHEGNNIAQDNADNNTESVKDPDENATNELNESGQC